MVLCYTIHQRLVTELSIWYKYFINSLYINNKILVLIKVILRHMKMLSVTKKNCDKNK